MGRLACRVQQPILLGSREIPSLCAQRLASSLVDSTSPRPIRSSAVASQTLRRGRPVLGGKGPAAGSHGEGRGAPRPSTCDLPASGKQIGTRQAAPARVKQSKSQQIVANAYASSSVATMGSCGVLLLSMAGGVPMWPVRGPEGHRTRPQRQVNWSVCESDEPSCPMRSSAASRVTTAHCLPRCLRVDVASKSQILVAGERDLRFPRLLSAEFMVSVA